MAKSKKKKAVETANTSTTALRHRRFSSSPSAEESVASKRVKEQRAVEVAYKKAMLKKRGHGVKTSTSFAFFAEAEADDVAKAYADAKTRRSTASYALQEAELSLKVAEATRKTSLAEVNGISVIMRTRGISRESTGPIAEKPDDVDCSDLHDLVSAKPDLIRMALSEAKRRSRAAFAAIKEAEMAVATKKATLEIANAQESGAKSIMKARKISEGQQTPKSKKAKKNKSMSNKSKSKSGGKGTAAKSGGLPATGSNKEQLPATPWATWDK